MPTIQLTNKSLFCFLEKSTKLFAAVVCSLVLLTGLFYANQSVYAHFVEPEKGDICPICGMAISEHPVWVAVIMFSDGEHVSFHGPKNMFTYYFNLGKYSKKYKKKNVATLHVTDYYTLKHVKAQKAHFVVHSSVQGPMGDDLIPFKDSASAKKFKKAYGGKILPFKEITPEIINALDNIVSENSPDDQ